jgi:DNA transformation protein
MLQMNYILTWESGISHNPKGYDYFSVVYGNLMINRAMKKNRELIELKNIGKKIAGRLNEIGIFSEKELREIGPLGAYKMIKEKYPAETLPVCYYLYLFEGALSDQHRDDIGEKRKRELNDKKD